MDLLDRLRTALADRYEVRCEIGRGGMAIVFLARDLRHTRDVAVKVLKPEFATAISADRFVREISLEARLSHPYILPLFDSGDVDGMPYYVMPYVQGESLQSLLNRETQLSLDTAIRIASDVAEALTYADEQGVVHRDVKPGNILLDESHAFLADFGIARAVSELAGERLSESGIVVGTPEYMSPEQCTEHGNVDGRSDVYALGCVVYEMLAGEPPFTGPTAQAIVARHLADQPRSLRVVRSSIPEHVEEAIQVALAKVPADRFATAVQFVRALRYEGEFPRSTRRRTARRRVARVTSGVVGGLALIGLGLWGSSARHAAPFARADDGPRSAPLSSIAVMYLEDRSEAGTLGHLSAGLTEDLIDRLAAVKSLQVISPDGVRPYRGKNLPLDSVVRAFHVGTVVTGTLTGSRDRLRASIRLIDAVNGVQLFGGTFEKPYGNVLELRDQLAEEVARQLRIRLGEAVQLRQRRADASNAVAWELVRRAEQLRNQALDLAGDDAEGSQLASRQADSLLVRAEKLDPAWTEPPILRGWLAMDRADLAAGSTDTAGAPGRALAAAWIRRGIHQADGVLRRYPNEPEALELKGTLRYQGWKMTGFSGPSDPIMGLDLAERDLRAASAVPGRHQGRALSTLSAVLQFAGKLDESHLQARRAYEADAYLRDASAILFRLFHTSLELKRYPEAQDWCEQGRRAFPRDWLFLFCQLRLLAWSPAMTPDVSRAWNVLAQLDTIVKGELLGWLRPQMTMMVAAVLARRGLADSAERVIAQAKASASPDPELRYYEALARVRLRQDTVAARLLAELLRQGPNFRPILRSHTEFASLWTDPQLRAWR